MDNFNDLSNNYMSTGHAAEATLHEYILDECLDDKILNFLLPYGKPHAWEGTLWDYKLKLPNTTGRGTPEEKSFEQHEVAELVKDIVAFHNAYGGYLIAGIDHYSPEPVIGCKNLNYDGFTIEKLNEQVASYTKKKINSKFRTLTIKNDHTEVQVGIILVPMRSPKEPVTYMLRGAPDKPKGGSAFKKGDIFARIDDECLPIQSDIQGIQFVCSQRKFGSEKDIISVLENNIPDRDPNLIRFVGRTNYLLQLWSWLIDKHAPVKILTALGGTGKTSIAYEFCRQVILSPPASLDKVIWLTAKKRSYSAILGKWVGVTRTDFETINGFLGKLASQLGVTSDEINQAIDDRDELLDLVLEGLRVFPSLVVVDDVDSLSLEDQSDLFSLIQTVGGRVFDSGSRFLLTSRLELNAGDSQRLRISGFEETEFSEYAKMIASERSVKLDAGVIQRLYKVSLGSPIFCASILRLVSLGADINSAIKQWKDRAGEDVRKFAFKRELEQLNDAQIRTLYALSMLGETTQLELKQVLNVDEDSLVQNLATLREYHLFTGHGDPKLGTKLIVPEPVRLMIDLVKGRVVDPTRIEKECARARAHSPKLQDKAAIAIGGIVSLWKEAEHDAALLSAKQATKEIPKNGDLQCILGRCYLMVTPIKPVEADKAFSKAFKSGCNRSELIPNWVEAKRLVKDWNGILDTCGAVPPNEVRGIAAVIHGEAILQLARQATGRKDLLQALELMRLGMDSSSKAISQYRAGEKIAEVREICRVSAQNYVHLASQYYERPGDKVDVFNAVIKAFECHVTETWMIDLAIESLMTWALDIDNRKEYDAKGYEILERRTADLSVIRLHLIDLAPQRDALVDRVLRAEERLSLLVKKAKK